MIQTITSQDAAESSESVVEATNPVDATPQEIVFLQAGIHDVDALTADLQQSATVNGRDLIIVMLDETESGLDQIQSTLSQYTELDAIHIVSHGSDGMIQLGGSWLTAGNVSQYQSQLQAWGISLSETGDILIYGCDVAAGPEGQAFIDTVAELTGAGRRSVD